MKRFEFASNMRLGGSELDEQQHSGHSVEETWHMNGGKQVESHSSEVEKSLELVLEFEWVL